MKYLRPDHQTDLTHLHVLQRDYICEVQSWIKIKEFLNLIMSDCGLEIKIVISTYLIK